MSVLSSVVLYANLLRDLRQYFTYTEYKAYQKSGILPRTWKKKLGSPVRKARALVLSRTFYKKFRDEQDAHAESRALLKFLERNSECSKWELKLQCDEDKILFGELRRALDDFFHPGGIALASDWSSLEEGRTGPGVSVGSSGQTFYNKLFSGPLTCSSTYLYRMYSNYIKDFPDWMTAEETRVIQHGEATIVKDSSLGFAAKERDVARVICSEKSLDMFFQLGWASVVERRLKSFWGIDISRQPEKNRELARQGSLSAELCPQQFVTIDLRDASDMPISMAKSVYPKSVFNLLMRYRSESTMIRGLGSYQLDILSSMGNGYTFPMQTTLFAAIVLAAYRANGESYPDLPHGRKLGDFGVFGDDIICPFRISDKVLRLLAILGFNVNHGKTFCEGPFRESCGSDFYFGCNVRGVYIKHLKTPQDRYSAINALNRWSAFTGIHLSRSVGLLARTVKFVPVPLWEMDVAGIKVPRFMAGRLATSKNGSTLYKAFRPQSLTWRVGDLGFDGPRHLISKLSWNPWGLWLSFLQGSLMSGTATLRQSASSIRYRLRRSVAPNWRVRPSSWIPVKETEEHPYFSLYDGVTWERCETAILVNLF